MSPEELTAIRERLRDETRAPGYRKFKAHAPGDIQHLLAEVERLTGRLNQDVGLLLGERDRALELSRSMAQEVHNAQARLDKVRALAEKWRYKGEFGWGAWQEGHGPDPEGAALDHAATELLRAIDGRGQ